MAEESKEVYLNIAVDKEGKVTINAQNVNPIDAISLCNIAIKEAIKQIQVKPESNITTPTKQSMNEALGINRIKDLKS